DDANALLHLNNERAVPGSASDTTLPALPTLVGITGAALLDSIMIEKDVVMFQNIETIMDYRRTCIPAITPVQSNFLNITAVPGELFYPQTERNVNAAHIPTESQELANGLRPEAAVNVCPGGAARGGPQLISVGRPVGRRPAGPARRLRLS